MDVGGDPTPFKDGKFSCHPHHSHGYHSDGLDFMLEALLKAVDAVSSIVDQISELLTNKNVEELIATVTDLFKTGLMVDEKVDVILNLFFAGKINGNAVADALIRITEVVDKLIQLLEETKKNVETLLQELPDKVGLKKALDLLTIQFDLFNLIRKTVIFALTEVKLSFNLDDIGLRELEENLDKSIENVIEVIEKLKNNPSGTDLAPLEPRGDLIPPLVRAIQVLLDQIDKKKEDIDQELLIEFIKVLEGKGNQLNDELNAALEEIDGLLVANKGNKDLLNKLKSEVEDVLKSFELVIKQVSELKAQLKLKIE